MATRSDTIAYKTAAILLAAIALEYFSGCKPHSAQASEPPRQEAPQRPHVLELVRRDARTVKSLERHTRQDRRQLTALIDSLNK